MPLTPNQLAMIHKKEAALPDALKRDPLTDYFEGWFFVTMNTRDEAPILSTCEGSPSIEDGKPGAPRCRYTKLGEGVIASWKKMATVCNTVELDMCEAMPEHFHGLVHLLPGNKRHLGSLISGFMSGCTHAYWDLLGIAWRKNRDARIEAKKQGKRAYAQLPPDRDKLHMHSLIGPALFVRGYNDVEPITPEEVQIKRDYIRDQARKRLIQGEHRDCFHIFRGKHSRNWRMDVALDAIAKDPYFARNANKREEAQRKVMKRLDSSSSLSSSHSALSSSQGSLSSSHSAPSSSQGALSNSNASPFLPQGSIPNSHSFLLVSKGSPLGELEGAKMEGASLSPSLSLSLSYLGNASIMAAKRKLPLICHRADASVFDRQKEAVINAARDGGVIVSAFISPKERDIREQLMTELLPFIEIMDNGFAERYKPIGKAFYAVAENRLVQISPWTYEYEKDTQISREMCMVMNELARVITGVRDDWWK